MNNVILSEEDIKRITKDIGQKITKELENEDYIPIIIGIMKGSMNFMMDIIKNVNVDIYTDYIQVSSYDGTQTTGKVTLKRDLTFNITNRTVVLVEDIIDTGISMKFLLQFLNDRYKPKRIILVALLDKKLRRQVEVKIDYVGKVLESDEFVYGYGLDYNELGRNLPVVYALSKEEIDTLDARIDKKILQYVNALNQNKKN